MSSRQEEKERRRQERMALEQKEAAAAARRKRLQYAFGGLLGLAAIAGIVILIASGASGDDGGDNGDSPDAARTPAAAVELPPAQETDFQAAAETAGCELINPEFEGQGHEERAFTAADYQSNPPTSGPHFPSWAEDGIYEAGNLPDLGLLVHTLEHGRINVQYAPGTDAATVDALEAFLAESNEGYHMLLYENPTNMEYQVAATAWTHILGCPEYNDRVPDALRTFSARYIDQGPERVP
jgi:hypothetical protein